MFTTTLTPPAFDQAAVDHYVAKGRRERSQALVAFFRNLFHAPRPVSIRRGTASA